MDRCSLVICRKLVLSKHLLCTILWVLSIETSAQSGVVIDEDGAPLPFCHVCVNDIQHCVVTGIDGGFDVSGSRTDTETLTFLYMGFETQTLRVENFRKSDTIRLVRSTTRLTPVFVTPLSAKELFIAALGASDASRDALVRNYAIWEWVMIDSSQVASYMGQTAVNGPQPKWEWDTLQSAIRPAHKAMLYDIPEAQYFHFMASEPSFLRLKEADHYDYEITGYYEKGFIITQRLKGLEAMQHFTHHIDGTNFAIEQINFDLTFEQDHLIPTNRRDTVVENFRWWGSVKYDQSESGLVLADLLVERFAILKVRADLYANHTLHHIGRVRRKAPHRH